MEGRPYRPETQGKKRPNIPSSNMRRNQYGFLRFSVYILYRNQHGIRVYKDRAAPPIGGPALHDSGVKTVQWRKREGHDSYQEVEVYIYKYIDTYIYTPK